ncbi:butyrophilin subfamily 3 member A1-like [Sparus aurata]|uniref:butyrophilin subfamily 3 member A1-like n=1 Tax=Sparus aurata TaxID=8175 RepID=UPI0011C16E93|nr:butyrophilin subfamily 3 member A1-like [Sparus aurata]
MSHISSNVSVVSEQTQLKNVPKSRLKKCSNAATNMAGKCLKILFKVSVFGRHEHCSKIFLAFLKNKTKNIRLPMLICWWSVETKHADMIYFIYYNNVFFSSSGSVASPFIAGIYINSTAKVLQCESTGWYPEPEVFWLDGEGNLLSAGPTETVRGPDDLYTVSSRVTVEKRHSSSFTCRVQQNHINQTRETEITVSADCLEFTSCSAHVGVLVVFVLLFIVAAVCVVWKWRQIQTKERNKQQEDPTHQLIGDRKKMADMQEKLARLEEELKKKDETLQKKEETVKRKEEELKDFEQQVYSKLTEQSEELQKQRDKLRQQQTDMETNITVIEKEMQSVEKMAEGERFHRMKEITLTAKTQLNKRKQEDENLNLQTTTILNKTTELLNKMTDRKKEEAQEESQ